MRKQSRIFVIFLLLFILPATIFAQRKLSSYVTYVETYGNLAVSQMNKYKIPASITLAQGILESGAGMSKFVKDSNNHFGIKCHRDWNGDKIYRTDDSPNECFRKYKRAIDSFEDHSLFLADKPRYASLFELDIKDYRSWSRGLQKCGYATDRAYANKLIQLIETYELYRYDAGKRGKVKSSNSEKNKTSNKKILPARKNREVFKTHGLIYVIAGKNDSYESIAYDLEFKEKSLIKYNEVLEDMPLIKGEIVYLQKKKKKADKPYYEHLIQVGESMHSISQQYGLQMSRLYKMNKKNREYVPEEGDVLRLR